ncbi:hypothetical protein [Bacillus sp. 2205SS5-2]|uniref:hypothetical protein n=1 Tax=Bacillus sp. 2205SS5-2 TaxID=3109031 RepID=UPI0030056804
MLKRTPVKRLNKLLQKAQEKENEKLILELWVRLYPPMMKKELEFVSFLDFKEKVSKPAQKVTDKSHKEIEDELLKIIENHEKKGGDRNGNL